MKMKRWLIAMLAGALLCASTAFAAEVQDEISTEKSDTLLMQAATPGQTEQDAGAAGLLKYSTVTDWDARLTRLNMAELGAALYEKISGTEIEPVSEGTFPDCDALAVRKVVAVGLMRGTGNGTFQPDGTSSRSEIATLLTRTIEKSGFSTTVYEDELSQLPSDVATSSWYYQSVGFLCVAVEYTENAFRPDDYAVGRDVLEWALTLHDRYEGRTPGQPVVTTWQDMGLQTEPALEGTEFWIYTPEELAWVAQKSLEGTTFIEKTVCLKADIDISAHEWVPIGSVGTSFQGTFDGCGHTISGLRVGSREWPTALSGGFLQGGTVRNVGYASGEVYSTNSSAAVLYAATAENCYSNVLVAAGGKLTDSLSRTLGNSYFRYHAEKNGYVGVSFVGGIKKELTEAELKSPEFLAELNDNNNQNWALWEPGLDGYPVMNTRVPHPDKSWIANAQPWEIDEADPNIYLIYTPPQLAQVAREAQLGNAFQGKTIRLMSDFSLAGKQWTPIGTKEAPFQGKFDGNHHTISGLTIGEDGAPSTAYVATGLFGYAGGEIISLNLVEAHIFSGAGLNSSGDVGGLVGHLDGGTVTDCAVQGVLSNGTEYFGYTGGLVGFATGRNRPKIERCSANVTVRTSASNNAVGGLVGRAESVTIRDCYAMGTIEGTEGVGGLIGDGFFDVYNSYSTADVTATGNNMPGGLVGEINNPITINACHWSIDARHVQDSLPISNVNKRAAGSGADSTPGSTLAELKQQETYVGWDFDTVWAIDPDKNGGLPYLRWQSVSQQPVQSVTLSKHDLTLYRGEELYLSASVSPTNAANRTVIWTSSAPAVATVNEYGLVTAVDGGTVTITVTTEDGGFTDACTVTVSSRGRPISAVVDKIQLKTESGQILNQIPTSGSFLTEVGVTVQGQPSADYYIMVAVYDADGALCDLSYMRTRIGDNHPIAYAVTVQNRPGRTIGGIKVMVLDGLSSLAPIGDAVAWR